MTSLSASGVRPEGSQSLMERGRPSSIISRDSHDSQCSSGTFTTAHTGIKRNDHPPFGRGFIDIPTGNRSPSSGDSNHSAEQSSYASSLLSVPASPASEEAAPYKPPTPNDPCLNLLDKGRQPCPGRHSRSDRKRRRRRCRRSRTYTSPSRIRFFPDAHRATAYWWFPPSKSSNRLHLSVNVSKHLVTEHITKTKEENPQPFSVAYNSSTEKTRLPAPSVVLFRWDSAPSVTQHGNTAAPSQLGGDPHQLKARNQIPSQVGNDTHSTPNRKRLFSLNRETPATITLRRATNTSSFKSLQSLPFLWNTTGERNHSLTSVSNTFPGGTTEKIGNSKGSLTTHVAHEGGPSVSEVEHASFSTAEDSGRNPSVTNIGILPRASVTDVATTITDISSETKLSLREESRLGRRKASTVSRVYTSNGLNEIIWEEEEVLSGSSHSSCSEEKTDKPVWSWTFSRAHTDGLESTQSFASLTSIRNSVSIPKHRFQVNPQLSGTEIFPEVISFPALGQRQASNDWISPLPDVDSELDDGVCLYSQGFDAHTGPRKSVATDPINSCLDLEKSATNCWKSNGYDTV